jgi:hypothetical protein
MAATNKEGKSPAKKSGAAPSKKALGGLKYSPAASASVEREMKAMEQGKLRTSAGDKVINPKQAIAIGLSEARREGDQAPDPPTSTARKTSSKKKAPAKKSAAK